MHDNKMSKAMSEMASEMESFSDVAKELKGLKTVIQDSNEELIATFVEGTKRVLKKPEKDETPAIRSLEKNTTEVLKNIKLGVDGMKDGIKEVERGVKAIKLPSNTDFRATGAMLKLPIKELTRTIESFSLPKEAKDAIPVRLSDGENFYKALDQVIQQFTGGGGSSYAFDLQGGSPTKAATVSIPIGDKNRDAIVSVSGLSLPPFDYVAMVLSPNTTETYTFKTGGASGTTVASVVIVYTDSTRADISTVTKT